MHKISQENAQVPELCLRLLSENSWVGAFIQSLLTLMDPARRGQVKNWSDTRRENCCCCFLLSNFQSLFNKIFIIFFSVLQRLHLKKKKENEQKSKFANLKRISLHFCVFFIFVSFHRLRRWRNKLHTETRTHRSKICFYYLAISYISRVYR